MTKQLNQILDFVAKNRTGATETFFTELLQKLVLLRDTKCSTCNQKLLNAGCGDCNRSLCSEHYGDQTMTCITKCGNVTCLTCARECSDCKRNGICYQCQESPFSVGLCYFCKVPICTDCADVGILTRGDTQMSTRFCKQCLQTAE